MKKSLAKKLCLAGMLLIGIFELFDIVLTWWFLMPFSTYISRYRMEKLLPSIENRIDDTEEELGMYIGQLAEDTNIEITIVDRDKNVICSTSITDWENNYIGTYTEVMFDEHVSELEQGKIIYEIKESEHRKSTFLLRVIKKAADDRYVILKRSQQSLKNATLSAVIFETLLGIIMVLISFLISYRMSKRLVMPIRNMSKVTEKLAKLNFDEQVDIKTEDELGQLGNSINIMSKHLEENIQLLQEDVETQKRLIRNLSHEIKSPVAVIMGYADRLKSIILKNPETALQYCEIISNESDRIALLVEEMLELSKLEQRAEVLHMDNFYAGKLFDALYKRFGEENPEKDIRYEGFYDREDMLRADYNLLERAVYNLLKNAIIYGKGEDRRIQIKGIRKQDFYEIRVYNSGSHISEEDIESVWEAFNRADKVRTPGKQGYGVGLSIVKEIVEMHSGYYSVENKDDGVEFLIAIKG